MNSWQHMQVHKPFVMKTCIQSDADDTITNIFYPYAIYSIKNIAQEKVVQNYWNKTNGFSQSVTSAEHVTGCTIRHTYTYKHVYSFICK